MSPVTCQSKLTTECSMEAIACRADWFSVDSQKTADGPNKSKSFEITPVAKDDPTLVPMSLKLPPRPRKVDFAVEALKGTVIRVGDQQFKVTVKHGVADIVEARGRSASVASERATLQGVALNLREHDADVRIEIENTFDRLGASQAQIKVTQWPHREVPQFDNVILWSAPKLVSPTDDSKAVLTVKQSEHVDGFTRTVKAEVDTRFEKPTAEQRLMSIRQKEWTQTCASSPLEAP